METRSEERRKEIEALKCRLQNRTPMRARFRLPLTKEETEEVLLASVKANIANRRMPFRMNDSLKRQLSEVADWLTGASSKFGLILCGGVGNGKSTFIRAIRDIVYLLSLKDEETGQSIELTYRDAKTILDTYSSDQRNWISFCNAEVLAIDDLGTEPLEIQNFGNIHSPMVELLTKRYDKCLTTIISTNLTPEQIRNKYGARISDRFNEMLMKVVFDNASYRRGV